MNSKRWWLLPLIVVLAAALAAGCGKKKEPAHEHEHAEGEAPHAHEAPHETPSTEKVPEGWASHAGISYPVPETWTEIEPKSSMRLAQYEIPGDGAAGEVMLFHFGAGGGGGVDANLRRWAGQFQMDDGSDSWGAASVDKIQTPAGVVHTIELSGRYVSAMPGAQPYNESGWRLMGGIVEAPGGPWFFKCVGPEATIQAAQAPFFDMLKSAMIAGG